MLHALWLPEITIRQGHARSRATGILQDDYLGYFSFAYSALASLRMGMSESASFQSARKS
jgi:hypothetical protein